MNPTKISAFAPATIANFNVGFDVLGLALSGIGDKVEVTPNNLKYNRITQIDNHNTLPIQPEKNSCTVVISKIQEYLDTPVYVDVRIKKGFASGSGLGSSSASSVAAAFAYNALVGSPFSREDLLPFAAEGERIACGAAHLDNVAPALLGGLTIIHQNKPIQLPIPKGLHAISFFPNIEVKTSSSRSILSKTIPIEVVSGQVANMGAFIAALYKNDLELMKKSMEDYLVEPTRKILIPYFDQMKETSLQLGGIAFGISGSGPSVFALAPNLTTAENIRSQMHQIYEGKGIKTFSFITDLKQSTGTQLCDYDD